MTGTGVTYEVPKAWWKRPILRLLGRPTSTTHEYILLGWVERSRPPANTGVSFYAEALRHDWGHRLILDRDPGDEQPPPPPPPRVNLPPGVEHRGI